MNKPFVILLIIALMLMLSCGNVALGPKEYIAHIGNIDNGYLQKAEAPGKSTVECIYKPLDLEALYRLHSYDVPKAKIDSVKNALGNNNYYELRIYYSGKPDVDESMYVNYYMENDTRWVTPSNDSISPNSYIAEPYNGVTPYQRVLISFPAKNAEEGTLVILGLQNSAYKGLSFSYSNQSLKKAKLKLKE